MNRNYWDLIYSIAAETGWSREYIDEWNAKDLKQFMDAKMRHYKKVERQRKKAAMKSAGKRSML